MEKKEPVNKEKSNFVTFRDVPPEIEERIERFKNHKNLKKAHPNHLEEVITEDIRLIRDCGYDITEEEKKMFKIRDEKT